MSTSTHAVPHDDSSCPVCGSRGFDSGWDSARSTYCNCKAGVSARREDQRADRAWSIATALLKGKPLNDIAAEQRVTRQWIRQRIASWAFEQDALRLHFLDEPELLASLQEDMAALAVLCRFVRLGGDVPPLRHSEIAAYRSGLLPERYRAYFSGFVHYYDSKERAFLNGPGST